MLLGRKEASYRQVSALWSAGHVVAAIHRHRVTLHADATVVLRIAIDEGILTWKNIERLASVYNTNLLPSLLLVSYLSEMGILEGEVSLVTGGASGASGRPSYLDASSAQFNAQV